MAYNTGTVREVIRLGILYKREHDFSKGFLDDIFESVKELDYTTPAESVENMRRDTRMVVGDMNRSIEMCKSEFELAEV